MTARRSLFVAAVALCSAAWNAAAYKIDDDGNGHRLHWRPSDMPVRYQLVSGNVPFGTAGENAVHDAFATWSDVTSNLDYQFDGYGPAVERSQDGHNTVSFVTKHWPYDHTILALTLRYFSASDGHLLDADVMLNGEDYTWTIGNSGVGFDIQNSTTHEVGHASGLGHSADSSAVMYATTYEGETTKRTLAQDDVAAIHALYDGAPTDGTASSTHAATQAGSVTGDTGGIRAGGCAIGSSAEGRGPAELGTVAIVLAALTSMRRRSSASLP